VSIEATTKELVGYLDLGFVSPATVIDKAALASYPVTDFNRNCLFAAS